METQKKLSKYSTRDVVEVGLMAALMYISTNINVPFTVGGTKSMIHLGTVMLFLSVLILKKNKAALSAAIGLSLYDALSPYLIFAPFTFVIKGGMAYIAGAIAFRKGYTGNNVLNNIIAFAAGGIFNILGYFVADTIIYHSAIIALGHVTSSVITTLIGIIIAIPAGKILKTAIKR